MQHRPRRAVEATGQKTREKILLVEIIGNPAIDEITEFLRAREIIDRDDLRHAPFVERFDEIRPDEPGRAGDDGIHGHSL